MAFASRHPSREVAAALVTSSWQQRATGGDADSAGGGGAGFARANSGGESAGEAARRSRSASQASQPSLDQDVSGDLAYAEDVCTVQECIRQIHGLADSIREEVAALTAAGGGGGSSASIVDGGRRKVMEASRKARTSCEEANRLLHRLSHNETASFGSGDMRSAKQQKLLRELLGATQKLEAAATAFEDAAAGREKAPSAVPTAGRGASAASGASSGAGASAGGAVQPSLGRAGSSSSSTRNGRAGAGGVELPPAGEEANAGLRQEQQQQVQLQAPLMYLTTEEAHVEMVGEYADSIDTLHSDIQGLQALMVSLAVEVHDQGDILDNIEANMTRVADTTESANDQLVQRNQAQRRGSRLLYCLLTVAGILAIAVVVAVVVRSNRGEDPDYATN